MAQDVSYSLKAIRVGQMTQLPIHIRLCNAQTVKIGNLFIYQHIHISRNLTTLMQSDKSFMQHDDNRFPTLDPPVLLTRQPVASATRWLLAGGARVLGCRLAGRMPCSGPVDKRNRRCGAERRRGVRLRPAPKGCPKGKVGAVPHGGRGQFAPFITGHSQGALPRPPGAYATPSTFAVDH